MDLSRHGLSRRPFRTAPDLHLFTKTSTHTQALQSWRAAFDAREPLALLDGDGGLGKTITAWKFLAELPEQTQRYYLPSCRFSRAMDLFQSILFDAEVEYTGYTEHEARLAVVEQVLRNPEARGPMVFVLDEAHHLNDDLLEEIRLLANYGISGGSHVFFGLCALPTLRTRLDKAGWSSLFGQRLCVRARLESLSHEEAAEYIAAQLQIVGLKKKDLFTTEALELAAAGSCGVPRLLNQIATTAWSIADDAGEKQIDAEAMMAALTQLGLTVEDGEDELPMKLATRSPSTRKPSQPSDTPAPAAEQRTERTTKPRKKAG